MTRAAATVLALLLGACVVPVTEGDERVLILTQTPSGTSGAAPEPHVRYPQGTRLVRIDLDRPDAPPVEISAGLAAAGGAAVAFDASRVLFVAREAANDPFAVWSARPDGTDRRREAAGPGDCGGAAWLADGRICWSAAVPDEPAPQGLASAWALFVGPGGGEPGERITFGPGAALDPAPLADGRIVYSAWQPSGDGRPEGGSLALFAVHPDGTGVAALHGAHDGPAWKLLPRQAASGDLLFTAGGPSAPGRIARADWRAPARRGLVTDSPPGDCRAVEPTRDGRVLACLVPEGLRLLDPTGAPIAEPLPAAPDFDVVHAVELARRPLPQGQLSSVDRSVAEGTLLCVDARAPGAPSASAVRVRTSDAGRERLLGYAPLESDGSFFLRVPADRPLYVDLLDADGGEVSRSLTAIWVRPRENRACIGCHESPETGPPNVRPRAVLADPRALEPTPPEGRR